MTKTLDEIVESILEQLSGYHLNNDFPIDPDFLKSKIIEINGSLMRDEYSSTMKLSEQFYFPYFCNKVECVGYTCVIDGIVVKKKLPIYKVSMEYMQTGIGWADIAYFGLPNMRRNFKRTNINGLSSMEYRTWTGARSVYAKSGKDLYIINLPTSGTRILASMIVYADPRKSPGWNDATSILPTPSNYKLELLVKRDILSAGTSDLKDDGQRAMAKQQPSQQNNDE